MEGIWKFLTEDTRKQLAKIGMNEKLTEKECDELAMFIIMKKQARREQ